MTTRKHLDYLVTRLAKLTNSPEKAYIKDVKGAQIGAFVLDHAACYGGYSLHRIVTETGGITVVNRSAKERMTNGEMSAFLHGMIDGLEQSFYTGMKESA